MRPWSWCLLQYNKTLRTMEQSQSKSQIKSTLRKKGNKDGNESDYSPQVEKLHSKKLKKSTRKIQFKKPQNYNNSIWTLQENIRYKDFLKQNFHLFSLHRQQRRTIKINVLISKHVRTRTSDQCRSHHQKMLIYHDNLQSIVEYIQNLQGKKEQPIISQIFHPEQQETVNAPILEMKEIEEVKADPPSLFDVMVQQDKEDNFDT